MVIISCLGNCNDFFPVFTLPTHHLLFTIHTESMFILHVWWGHPPSSPQSLLKSLFGYEILWSWIQNRILSMGLKTLCSLVPCAFPSHHAPVFPCLSALQQGLHPGSHTHHVSSHLEVFAHAIASTRNIVFPVLHLVKSFYSVRVDVLRKDFPVTLIQVRFIWEYRTLNLKKPTQQPCT